MVAAKVTVVTPKITNCYYLNRITSAGRTQSIVVPIGTMEIPETQLRPLTSVPDDIKKQI